MTPAITRGFARTASESAYPSLWRRLTAAWTFGLGHRGVYAPDYSGHGQASTAWTNLTAADWHRVGGRLGVQSTGGTGDTYITTPTRPAELVSGASMTVVCWVRFTSFASIRSLVKSSNSNTGFSFTLSDTSPFQGLRFYIGDGADYHFVQSAHTILSADTWYHVAGRYDGATLTVWLDGVQVGSASDAFTPNFGTSGANSFLSDDSPDSLPGYLADVRLYDRALSNAELALDAGVYLAPFVPRRRLVAFAPTVTRTGSLTATLEDLSVSAAGAVAVAGSLTATLEDLSVSAAGFVGSRTGSLTVTLGTLGLTAAGSVAQQATGGWLRRDEIATLRRLGRPDWLAPTAPPAAAPAPPPAPPAPATAAAGMRPPTPALGSLRSAFPIQTPQPIGISVDSAAEIAHLNRQAQEAQALAVLLLLLEDD